jgi:hypothetical protein
MVVDDVFGIRLFNVLFALHGCVSFTWVEIFHFSHRLGNSGASIMPKAPINAITSLASGHQCELLESAYKLREALLTLIVCMRLIPVKQIATD